MLRLAPSVCLLCLLSWVCSGCNLRAAVATAQVDAARDASEAGTRHWDPEIVGPALAASTVEMEGTLKYIPDYEPALLGLIESYYTYGVGWVNEAVAEAEARGDFDEADRQQRRAGLLFDRALMYAKRMLRLRDDGFDDALHDGLDAFKAWIDEHFYDPEEDAEVALVAGTAWFTTIQSSEEGLAASVDLPFARALIERSVELDPTLSGARGLNILGMVECLMPELMGGNPKRGLELLQRAARITDRQVHGILVEMAASCAVALGDRELFRSRLMEVIEAGDVPEHRLANKIARQRAERLLGQIDELIYD